MSRPPISWHCKFAAWVAPKIWLASGKTFVEAMTGTRRGHG
ncbi:MAG TPA: hypothetical protein PLH72_07370 [Vicinamibacterales bacterium]|nr:hypothetical protein [Vicinamibacterales bacterium]